MSLDTYANLQVEIADWLARTDLTAKIPTFITLAEAEMKRRLRRTSAVGTVSISTESVAPPATLSELRSIWPTSGSPSQDGPLRVCTPEMLMERRARNAGGTGRPTDFALMAGLIYVSPIPDQTYTLNLFYFTQLIPLSASNATNAVLTEAPDAYLCGALLQAEPYLENDDRIPTWRTKFDAAIDQLNLSRENEEYNASISSVRLPIVFG